MYGRVNPVSCAYLSAISSAPPAVTSSYFHAVMLHVPFRLFTVPFRLFITCGLACGSPTVLSVNIDTTRIRSPGVSVL